MKQFLTPNDLDESDLKYLAEEPDPGFSPYRNAANIKKAIDSGIKIELELRKAGLKDMEYRIDVLSGFARNSIGKGKSQSLEKYVGKREMAKIYGEKILEKVRIMDSVQKLNRAAGNTMLDGKFFLT